MLTGTTSTQPHDRHQSAQASRRQEKAGRQPRERLSKVVAIMIAFMGLLLSGILIAVAAHAATLAMESHDAVLRVR